MTKVSQLLVGLPKWFINEFVCLDCVSTNLLQSESLGKLGIDQPVNLTTAGNGLGQV